MNVEQNLFRMNFVMQDNAATTLAANLVKIIEAVLFEEKHRMKINEVQKVLNEKYDLEFSYEEIVDAVKRKGKNFVFNDNEIELKKSYAILSAEKRTFSQELETFVSRFIKDFKFTIEESYLRNLIMDYLYFCFNSNKVTLLALLSNRPLEKNVNKYSDDEVYLINSFLAWDNEAKDKFIYNVISYCYIYCTLTVKRDKLLASKLFRGKRFILDANIIFRLAGINNDSRKLTVDSFVRKCAEVGIELCYSSFTLDEVYRVIETKVNWIRSVVGYQAPIDVNEFGHYDNDFYKIYCKWYDDAPIGKNDYESFQGYLIQLIDGVLSQFKLFDAQNFEICEGETFGSYFDSLEEYKHVHCVKQQSKASISTDVNNYLYVKRMRGNNKSNGLWTTNDFLISADQNLIGWAVENESGVPVVVLPSVWLTIILRFCGRTADDYKAFCSFLELRSHAPNEKVDIFQILQQMTSKTDSNDIKKRIVREIFEHKGEYINEDEINYNFIVEKAFDSITEKEKDKFEKVSEELEEQRRINDENALHVEIENKKKMYKIIEHDVTSRFRFAEGIFRFRHAIAFAFFLIIIVVAVITIFRIEPINSFLLNIFDRKTVNMGNLLAFWAVVAVAISGFSFFAKRLIEYSISDGRKQRFRKKREQHYIKILSN